MPPNILISIPDDRHLDNRRQLRATQRGLRQFMSQALAATP
jgi:hypothetical protein